MSEPIVETGFLLFQVRVERCGPGCQRHNHLRTAAAVDNEFRIRPEMSVRQASAFLH